MALVFYRVERKAVKREAAGEGWAHQEAPAAGQPESWTAGGITIGEVRLAPDLSYITLKLNDKILKSHSGRVVLKLYAAASPGPCCQASFYGEPASIPELSYFNTGWVAKKFCTIECDIVDGEVKCEAADCNLKVKILEDGVIKIGSEYDGIGPEFSKTVASLVSNVNDCLMVALVPEVEAEWDGESGTRNYAKGRAAFAFYEVAAWAKVLPVGVKGTGLDAVWGTSEKESGAPIKLESRGGSVARTPKDLLYKAYVATLRELLPWILEPGYQSLPHGLDKLVCCIPGADKATARIRVGFRVDNVPSNMRPDELKGRTIKVKIGEREYKLAISRVDTNWPWTGWAELPVEFKLSDLVGVPISVDVKDVLDYFRGYVTGTGILEISWTLPQGTVKVTLAGSRLSVSSS